MSVSRQFAEGSIEEIQVLYNKATKHYLYVGAENQESRKLEAFLMLAILLEGVLTSFGLVLLGKRSDLSALLGKRKKRYGIENAINDLYLLGKISNEEFGELERFKNDRNKCVHEIFRGQNNEKIERYTNDLFEKHKTIFEEMTEKFKEESQNPSKK